MLKAAYVLFNPAKLDDVPMLLERHSGRERDLLLRVCGKYAVGFDDWRELLLRLHRSVGDKAVDLPELEARLEQQRGREQALIEDLCKQWLEEARAEAEASPPPEGPPEPVAWAELRLVLQRESPGAPLGIRHDRMVLEQQRRLLVREVVPGSPASRAGVCPGDIVERIGEADAAEVALRARTAAAEPDGAAALTVELTLRRPPSSGAVG